MKPVRELSATNSGASAYLTFFIDIPTFGIPDEKELHGSLEGTHTYTVHVLADKFRQRRHSRKIRDISVENPARSGRRIDWQSVCVARHSSIIGPNRSTRRKDRRLTHREGNRRQLETLHSFPLGKFQLLALRRNIE